MKFRISQFVAKGIKSLVWEGDELVDWVAGGRRFRLDGRVIEPNVRYAFAFDAARNSPSGEFSVIYTRCATKGLVLQRGKVLREINRSFYHAAVYEYPIAMFALADGREAIAARKLSTIASFTRSVTNSRLVTGDRIAST